MSEAQVIVDMVFKATKDASEALQRVADLMPTVDEKLTVAIMATVTFVATFEEKLDRFPHHRATYDNFRQRFQAAQRERRP